MFRPLLKWIGRVVVATLIALVVAVPALFVEATMPLGRDRVAAWDRLYAEAFAAKDCNEVVRLSTIGFAAGYAPAWLAMADNVETGRCGYENSDDRVEALRSLAEEQGHGRIWRLQSRPWAQIIIDAGHQAAAFVTPDDPVLIGLDAGSFQHCYAYAIDFPSADARWSLMRGLASLSVDEVKARLRQRRSDCRDRYEKILDRYQKVGGEAGLSIACSAAFNLQRTFNDADAVYFTFRKCSKLVFIVRSNVDAPFDTDGYDFRLASAFGHHEAAAEYANLMLDQMERIDREGGNIGAWLDPSFAVYLHARRAVDVGAGSQGLIQRARVRLTPNCLAKADNVYRVLGPVWGGFAEDREAVFGAFIAAQECLPEFQTHPDSDRADRNLDDEGPEDIVAGLTEYFPLCGYEFVVDGFLHVPDADDRIWVD